jgi:hypothetical protein
VDISCTRRVIVQRDETLSTKTLHRNRPNRYKPSRAKQACKHRSEIQEKNLRKQMFEKCLKNELFVKSRLNCHARAIEAFAFEAGLPDFSWYIIPNPEIYTKFNKWSLNIPNVHKIFLMAKKIYQNFKI